MMIKIRIIKKKGKIWIKWIKNSRHLSWVEVFIVYGKGEIDEVTMKFLIDYL